MVSTTLSLSGGLAMSIAEQSITVRPELSCPAFVSRVRNVVAERLEGLLGPVETWIDQAALSPGKMLRTRLAGRLLEAWPPGIDRDALTYCCAACEMVHTASLCHDDIIDGGKIRRAAASLWCDVGVTSAILLGDALLCESVDTVASVAGGRHTRSFLAAVREVLVAEAEQELLSRAAAPDEDACLRLARQKTGPLFGFVAGLCGGGETHLSAVLREVGYAFGTGYQLMDDLLDVTGEEDKCGKTLGTDGNRHTPTLAQGRGDPSPYILETVAKLWGSTAGLLAPWPAFARQARVFLDDDLRPMLRQQGTELLARACV
jgi:heptaprenyl diphosphate synthase